MAKWTRWKKWLALTLILEWRDPRERRAIAVGAVCALGHVALASWIWEASEHGALPVPWMLVLLVDLPWSVLLCAFFFLLGALEMWLQSLGLLAPGAREAGSPDLWFPLIVGASGTVWWFYIGLWFGRLFKRGQ